MTDRELMQQALEALEDARGELAAYHEDAQGEDYNNPALNDAIDALRERLAQPEFDSALQSAATTQTTPKLEQPEQWEQFYPDMGKPLDRMAENARELGLDYAPVQEPKACPYCHNSHTLGAVYFDQSCAGCVKRMTTPPRREWQGLTEEERRGIREWQRIQEELGPVWAPMMLYLYEAIEAKLRERNA